MKIGLCMSDSLLVTPLLISLHCQGQSLVEDYNAWRGIINDGNTQSQELAPNAQMLMQEKWACLHIHNPYWMYYIIYSV